MSALLTILAGLTMTWYIGKIVISTYVIWWPTRTKNLEWNLLSNVKLVGNQLGPGSDLWVELDDALGHLSDHHQTNWLASRSFWTGVINSLLLSQEWKWWLFMKGLKLSWKWMVSWKLGISYELSCRSKKIS